MKIVHQFSFSTGTHPKLFQLVKKSGIKASVADLPDNKIITVSVPEDHSLWPEFQLWTDKTELLHGYDTFFSVEEILCAEWVRIVNVVLIGYPEPQASWITNPINCSNFCKECGAFEQISPFRITKEPRLGKKCFMSLNWTSNCLFTRPEILQRMQVNGIKGFEIWPALLHKSGYPAKNIEQIFITQKTEPGLLDKDKLPINRCTRCGTEKYGYHRRGKMNYKRESIPIDLDIILSGEWFGAGMGPFAFREILVSNRFVKHLGSEWKGFSMKVVELH